MQKPASSCHLLQPFSLRTLHRLDDNYHATTYIDLWHQLTNMVVYGKLGILESFRPIELNIIAVQVL